MSRRMGVTSGGPDDASAGRRLALILVLGLVLRLVFLATTVRLDARIVDEQQYLALAQSLADGRGFATASGPTSLRPPLYPAVVAAVWTVTGTRSLVVIRGVQILMALVTTWLVYRLGRALFDPRTGLAAAAIVCFYPALLFANLLMLTETLFTLLVVLVLVGYHRVVATGSPVAAVATGATVGLAALTRSVLWPFAPALAVFTLLAVRESWGRRLALATLLLVGWATVLAPWSIRNSGLWGMPVVVDTMGGMNLRMGNYEHTPHERIWDAVSNRGAESWLRGMPEPPAGRMWTEAEKERWARQEAVAFIKAHPGLTAWRAVIKFGDFWALDRDFFAAIQRGLYQPPAWFATLATLATLVAYPMVAVLAVLGAWARPPSDWRDHLLCLGIVAFVCALHVIVFAHPRYRLPLTPILSLYAASALIGRAWRPSFASPRSALVPAAVTAGLVATWVVQFAWRDWPRAASALRTLVAG